MIDRVEEAPNLLNIKTKGSNKKRMMRNAASNLEYIPYNENNYGMDMNDEECNNGHLRNLSTFLIIIAIGVGLCFLCMLISNRVLAIIVAVPLVELLVCVLGLNCETYVISLVEENKIEKRVEKEKAAAIEQYKNSNTKGNE